MSPLVQTGKLIMIIGGLLLVFGALLMLAGKIFGQGLPGDFYLRRNNITFYFPLATSVLISLILSLLFWLFSRK